MNLIPESIPHTGNYWCTGTPAHTFPLKDIEQAYEIFENKLDGVIKIAITDA